MSGRGFICTLILVVVLVLLFFANLFYGSADIPAEAVFDILLGADEVKESWRFIVLESRLPQAFTALLCGSSLAVSGLMLQTVFANPLAGPSVLGINSGASLGVAVVMLFLGGSVGAGAFSVFGFFSVVAGAFLGSLAVLAVILFFSALLKSNMMVLVVGIMVGYLASSLISLLNFAASAEGVHSYVVWGMGSFGNVSSDVMPYFALLLAVGLFVSVLMIKTLNALLLGERYAENLGVNVKMARLMILATVGLLTSVVTAFCGPVAFIGLAVPHISRLMLGSSSHDVLLPQTMALGAVVALLCNVLCVLPGDGTVIPVNAMTPVLGAPVIIYVIVNQRKIQYLN